MKSIRLLRRKKEPCNEIRHEQIERENKKRNVEDLRHRSKSLWQHY